MQTGDDKAGVYIEVSRGYLRVVSGVATIYRDKNYCDRK